MNNKLINNKKKHSFEYLYLLHKKIKKQNGNFSDPDPLFPEVDPRFRIRTRIQIHIKMKWIVGIVIYMHNI